MQQRQQEREVRMAAYARTQKQLQAQRQVLSDKSRVLEQGFAEVMQARQALEARQQAARELDKARQVYAEMQQAWRQDAAQHPVRTALGLTQRQWAPKLEAEHE